MAEQDVTHAGHPLNHHRWCVNDLCNRQALAEQAQLAGHDELDVFKGKP